MLVKIHIFDDRRLRVGTAAFRATLGMTADELDDKGYAAMVRWVKKYKKGDDIKYYGWIWA